MALEKEMQVYRREVKNRPDEEGQFILIHGEEVIGVWKDRLQALEAGYERYGLEEPFLVKQLLATRPAILMPFDIFPDGNNQTPSRSKKRPG
jgi:hypothetical protein